jgi:dihydroorotase
MSERVDLIVRHGTVVTSEGSFEGDIACDGGQFAAIAARGTLDVTADEEIDATGLYVLPGVIDGHVHFREPGYEYKEDWTHGSTAAVMGGVTTVFDMPNVIPLTSNVEGAQIKKEVAESKSYCDFGFFAVVLQENVADIAPLGESGLIVGYKAFLGTTIGNIPAPDDGVLLEAFEEIRKTGLRIGFHAENNDIMEHEIARLKAEGRTDAKAHVDSRPAIAEVESIQRMGLFGRHTGTKLHIYHLSSKDGLEMIDEWRAKGVDYTCETGAHYCFLTKDDMDQLGSVLRMNPPVREPGHGEPLFHGLLDGRVNAIATDHSPHTAEEKRNDDIWKAISGFAGVETSLRLFLTYGVNTGRMTLPQLVRATSEGPAKVWDVYPRKGALLPGSDADLTIVDLGKVDTIEADRLHSKNNTNPFEGHETRGAAVATVVRGAVVMRDGELVAEPRGRMVHTVVHEPMEAVTAPA